MTTDYSKILRQYGQLMTEAKNRLHWIEFATKGSTGLDGYLVDEFCYLQLRLVCEVTALASLAAHNDIPAVSSSKLQRLYDAPRIFRELDSLHPDFFPRAFEHREERPMADGHTLWRMTNPSRDCMTKEEMIKLYNACGAQLHRGSFKSLARGRPVVKTHSQVLNHTLRFWNLLMQHTTALIGGERLLCQFKEEGVETVMSLPAELPPGVEL